MKCRPAGRQRNKNEHRPTSGTSAQHLEHENESRRESRHKQRQLKHTHEYSI